MDSTRSDMGRALGRLSSGVAKKLTHNGLAQRKLAGIASGIARTKKPKFDLVQRYQCYKAFFEALKSGEIERRKCQRCGDPRAQGHHEDYSRPLAVTWLCRKCHGARHGEINRSRKMFG